MKKLLPEFAYKYEMLTRFHHDENSHICIEHQLDDLNKRKRGRRSVNESSENVEVYCLQTHRQILAEASEDYQQEHRREDNKENVLFTPVAKSKRIIQETPVCKAFEVPHYGDENALLFTPIVSPPCKNSISAFYTSSFLNDTCASSNMNSYSLRTPDQNKTPYSVLFESPSFMLNFDASPQ